MEIKTIVKDNFASFDYLRHNIAYYGITVENQKFRFPVPLSDLGDASIQSTEKAIHLMRYIRKAIEDSTFVKA